MTIARLGPIVLAIAGLAACGDDSGGEGGAGGATASSSSTASNASSGTSSSNGSSSGSGDASSSASGADGGSGGTGGGEGGAGIESFSIAFRGDVAGEAFDCAAQYDVGTPTTTATLTDFRFYVHDVRLLDAGGAEVPLELDQDGLWQYENVALLDFEDRSGACSNGTTEVRTVVEGAAPTGEYVGIAFKVGLPAELNHLDSAQAPSPLNLSGLFWEWTSGYKYLRVDAVADGADGPFNLHLGATGCTGDPALDEEVTCTNPNVAEVVLDGFDPAMSVVVFDYADAVATADVSTDGGGAPGCMSGSADPECAAVFPTFGLDVETGAPDGSTPTAFHVE